MIDAVIARLKDQVPEFSGRIEGAADFTELMRKKALPKVTPAAHVLPLGLQGGQADMATGLFSQHFNETVGVLLTFRTNSRSGKKALVDVRTLIFKVIEALAGWATGGEVGVFKLARGQLVNMSAGTLVYQLDFTIIDQLRITP